MLIIYVRINVYIMYICVLYIMWEILRLLICTSNIIYYVYFSLCVTAGVGSDKHSIIQ